VLRRIILAWCVTFPFCALVAFLAALVANRISY
jgi:phosphate/sulfate permease